MYVIENANNIGNKFIFRIDFLGRNWQSAYMIENANNIGNYLFSSWSSLTLKQTMFTDKRAAWIIDTFAGETLFTQ